MRPHFFVLSIALVACGSETGDSGSGAGGESASSGDGGGTSGDGGSAPNATTTVASTGPEPQGCDNFANWECQFAEERDECFANCREEDVNRQIACAGNGLCDSTGESTCEGYVGQQLPECGDCAAAFAAGCTGI